MLELIILRKDSNENGNIEKKYSIDPNQKNDGHLSGCITFCKEENIDIDGIEEMTSYQASIEIANLGYVNIHIENRNMLIYLPSVLTEEQSKWFKDNKSLLSRFQLNVMSIQTDGNLFDLSDLNEYDNSYCKINDLKREIRKKDLIRQKLELQSNSNMHM